MEEEIVRGHGRGKLLLWGEYGVLAGASALGLTLSGEQTVIRLRRREPSPPGNPEATQEESLLRLLFRRGRDFLAPGNGGAPEDFSFRTECRVSGCGGLGSSAALSVAVSRLLLRVYPSSVSLRSLAHHLEEVFHGNPSGADTALAAREKEGLVLLRSAGENTWEPEEIRAEEDCVLVLGALPRQQGTKAFLKKIKEGGPAVRESLRRLKEELDEGERALRKTGSLRYDLLEALIPRLRRPLRSLGASVPALDLIVEKARRDWGSAGKLSGAGGGGSFFLLCPRGMPPEVFREKLQNFLKEKGIETALPLRIVDLSARSSGKPALVPGFGSV